MTKKNALLSFAFVVSFLLGCLAGGAAVFFRVVPPMAEMATLANLSYEGNQAYVKYRYGTYFVAKTALLGYADLTRNLHDHDAGRVIGSEALTFDLGLTYGRLARAGERGGHKEEASQYMTLAKEMFTKRGYPGDEAQVRATIERLDRAWDKGLAAEAK